jgi:hypothetical protein
MYHLLKKMFLICNFCEKSVAKMLFAGKSVAEMNFAEINRCRTEMYLLKNIC